MEDNNSINTLIFKDNIKYDKDNIKYDNDDDYDDDYGDNEDYFNEFNIPPTPALPMMKITSMSKRMME